MTKVEKFISDNFALCLDGVHIVDFCTKNIKNIVISYDVRNKSYKCEELILKNDNYEATNRCKSNTDLSANQ